MSGTKATGKTIGEVERITGIPKRELKYYMEQGVMRPSQKSESGYWLYSSEDIQRARLASLCRELGFPVQAIRAILADPALHWPEELERQRAAPLSHPGRRPCPHRRTPLPSLPVNRPRSLLPLPHWRRRCWWMRAM